MFRRISNPGGTVSTLNPRFRTTSLDDEALREAVYLKSKCAVPNHFSCTTWYATDSPWRKDPVAIQSSTDMKLDNSKRLLDENARYIPGGVASINRLTDPPICFTRARGAYMWDADGQKYIDYHAGFAPHILGFNDPDLTAAVRRSLDEELALFGSGATADEGALAKLFLQCVPFAERVQFTNTGSEATAQAIRVARAATGKEHVILIQGSYNGQHNVVAANVMSDKASLGGKQVRGDEYPLVPMTAGTPRSEQGLMHAVEFNDLAAVRTVAERHEVAALITEPVLQNVGVIKPVPGYLQGLRDLATELGFLLIFDEVKTGFRASLGGYQSLAGVAPDLSTFGKALANGYPIGALAGKAEYLDLTISSKLERRVLIAGTYNCHPVPVAAAIACLQKLRDPNVGVYQRLEALSQRLEEGQKALFAEYDVAAVVARVASAHCVYFAEHAPANWWDVLDTHDFEFDKKYRLGLIEGGIYTFPLPCKQSSISFAHSEADIDRTLEVTEQVLRSLTV